MLKIYVELWPHGNRERKSRLRELRIINDGSGDKETGNYLCEFFDEDGNPIEREYVKGFPRLELGPWSLVAAALKKLGDT